jgi:hypothetical protein
VEAEEEDEREQDGADDERRHGGGQAAAAALIGRQQQGRGMLLLLVPLHGSGAVAPPLLCSTPQLPPLLCSASASSARLLQLSGGAGGDAITSALSYRKQGKQAAFFLLGRGAFCNGTKRALLRLHQAGVEWRETGVCSGAEEHTLSLNSEWTPPWPKNPAFAVLLWTRLSL